MLMTYHPEMGQARPQCEIEAKRMFGGTHFVIKTELELIGRGIERKGKEKDGRNKFYVTMKSFNKMVEKYSIALLEYLD